MNFAHWTISSKGYRSQDLPHHIYCTVLIIVSCKQCCGATSFFSGSDSGLHITGRIFKRYHKVETFGYKIACTSFIKFKRGLIGTKELNILNLHEEQQDISRSSTAMRLRLVVAPAPTQQHGLFSIEFKITKFLLQFI
jgi:hypothetical protein